MSFPRWSSSAFFAGALLLIPVVPAAKTATGTMTVSATVIASCSVTSPRPVAVTCPQPTGRVAISLDAARSSGTPNIVDIDF